MRILKIAVSGRKSIEEYLQSFFPEKPLSEIEKIDISGTTIQRPTLIDIVDVLENSTGKTLSDCQNPFAPLRYLDDVLHEGEQITLKDIIDFFDNGSDKINELSQRVH